jgi:hypothetical protein
VLAIDRTPGDKSSTGPVCQVDSILVEDNQVAGLDHTGSGAASVGTINGTEVTGCIAVDFGEGAAVTSLTLRMLPVADACTTACAGSGCASNSAAGVFGGATLDTLQHFTDITLTGVALQDYDVTIPKDMVARFAMVCRSPSGSEANDIAVDAISGTCR